MAQVSIEDLESKAEQASKSTGRKNESSKGGISLLFNGQPKQGKKRTKSIKANKVKKINKTATVKQSEELKIIGELESPKKEFTKVPNSLVSLIVEANLNSNEIKFIMLILKETLGWNKPFCHLSKTDIARKSSISPSLIYKTRSSLSENGVISFGKDSSLNKTYYYLNKAFIDKNESRSDDEGDSSIVPDEIINYLSRKGYTLNVIEQEKEKFLELVNTGRSAQQILELAEFLDNNNLPNGDICARPFAFLASGSYESVLARTLKKSTSINKSLIIDLISNNDLNSKLEDLEIYPKLSDSDLAWIDANGGRVALSNLSNYEFNKVLGSV